MSPSVRDQEVDADSVTSNVSAAAGLDSGSDGGKPQEEEAVATSVSSERPTKKMKRGKYISRAW